MRLADAAIIGRERSTPRTFQPSRAKGMAFRLAPHPMSSRRARPPHLRSSVSANASSAALGADWVKPWTVSLLLHGDPARGSLLLGNLQHVDNLTPSGVAWLCVYEHADARARPSYGSRRTDGRAEDPNGNICYRPERNVMLDVT